MNPSNPTDTNNEELEAIEKKIAPLFGYDVRQIPGRHFVNRTVIRDLAKFIASRDQQIALAAQLEELDALCTTTEISSEWLDQRTAHLRALLKAAQEKS